MSGNETPETNSALKRLGEGTALKRNALLPPTRGKHNVAQRNANLHRRRTAANEMNKLHPSAPKRSNAASGRAEARPPTAAIRKTQAAIHTLHKQLFYIIPALFPLFYRRSFITVCAYTAHMANL